MNKYLLSLALIFLVSADQDLSSTLQVVQHSLAALDKIPTSLAADKLPSMEAANEMLKEKCSKAGNNESYEAAVVAKDSLELCFKDTIDWKTMQSEIQEAKPKGELDSVFKKYCGKSLELKKCVANFTTALEGCLNEEEEQSKKVMENITDSLANFICYQEGDRIALFIAEGGPECINSKFEDIEECLNSTFMKYIPKGGFTNSSDFPTISFGEEGCNDLSKFEVCVVERLERCPESTPANIVGSLFRFIRKRTPCAKFVAGSLQTSDGPGGSASIMGVSFSSLFVATAIGILVSLNH